MKKIMFFAAGLIMMAATACTNGAATDKTADTVDTTEVVVDSVAGDTVAVEVVDTLVTE